MSKTRTVLGGLAFAAAFAGVVTAAPASAAPIPGCATSVCIGLDWRDGNFYQVTGYHDVALNPEIYGHIHLTGPGGLDLNTNDKVRPIITGSGVGPGRACAELWKALGGGQYSLVNTACIDI
ncbi:hypothetical protein ACIRG5_07440 [Lentzea sp. NPDC102401]|uniref:hypothetical protein n=1 Tax=Lentzea sp. NPDC102401 TaxID=3364128 RepID=UPI0037F94C33